MIMIKNSSFPQVCFNDLLKVIKTNSKNVMKFIKTKII